MIIRKAQYDDLTGLIRIFDSARDFMRENGNMVQWTNGYPSIEIIKNDIDKGNCYLCIEEEKVVATFCFIQGNDSTYNYIENGNWTNEYPYSVIHRLASDGTCKRIATKCIDWCTMHCNNIRVDTHEANTKMRSILIEYGFKECGVIYVKDGTPRMAFQYYKTTELL